MRSADFRTILDRCPADVALFSTYAFQPTYFERSLLNSSALVRACRIVVLMDGSQYLQLQKDGEPARHLNHRYLLVPIFRSNGIFHPKLHLLASKEEALVFCGSSNLTQPGCTHNLEILNAIQFKVEDGEKPPATVALAQQSIAFFEDALETSKSRSARLAKEWIDDLKYSSPWLQPEKSKPKIDSDLQLHHSLNGPLWDTVKGRVGTEKVERVTAISPFYDQELSVLKVMKEEWPNCNFRIVAQQHTSNLPIDTFDSFAPQAKLFALNGPPERRLHAKIITIETDKRTIVVAGSANFTREAWRGINVEACFIWDTNINVEEHLFSDELEMVSIDPKDFAPGDQDQPLPDSNTESKKIRLNEAILKSEGKISLEYSMDNSLLDGNISLLLYPAGRIDPLPPISLPANRNGQNTVIIPESDRSEIRNSVTCELIVSFNNKLEKSPLTWLVQEDALTYVPGEGNQKTKSEREVIESGRGLGYLLEEIEDEDGFIGLARWLNEHTIHFSDQQRTFWGRLHGIPRKRDPFRSDDSHQEESTPPIEADQKMVQKAVQNFAERHRKQRLERHANKGNIYGLRNYMDIFIAVNSRVFEYYVRGLVKAPMAVGLIKENLNTTIRNSQWRDEDGDDHEDLGYLQILLRKYETTADLLLERLLEANVPGHLFVSLLMAQIARVSFEKNEPAQPHEMLSSITQDIKAVLHKLKANQPTGEELRRALREYEFCLPSTEELLLVEIQR